MKLTIPLLKEMTDGFLVFLKQHIYEYIESHIDEDRCNLIDEYIKSSNIYTEQFKKQFSCKDIILCGQRNIVCKESKGCIVFEVDEESCFISNGIKIKIQGLCKLINYGNMEIKGLGIFDKAFQFVQGNLKTYMFMYKVRAMGR